MQEHLRRVEAIHQQDLADGYGRVELSHALARKYPNANREWCWQFVFPQERRWRNAKTGEQGCHHIDESLFQRALKAAVPKAGLTKRITSDTFRHSCISVAKASRISAFLRGVMGVFGGLVLVWSVAWIVSSGPPAFAFALVLFPLVFGLLGCLLGYVGTAMNCALYNFLARRIGGIEITLKANPEKANDTGST